MQTDFSPMSAAELMDRAFDIYKKSFGKQIAFAALFFLVFFVSLILFGAIIIAIAGSLFLVSGLSFTDLLPLFPFVILFFVLWYSASQAVHILLSRQAFYGHRVKLPARQLPLVIFRVCLTVIAQFIVSLPFIGLFALINMSAVNVAFVNAGVWVLPLLTLVLMLGYLLYTNIFLLSITVSVFEGKTFFNAIYRSWQLTKCEFWKIAGMRIIWILIIIMIGLSIWGGSELTGMLINFVVDSFDLNILITTILSNIALVLIEIALIVSIILIIPLEGTFLSTLYFNQRIKKEGLDIEISLGRLSL